MVDSPHGCGLGFGHLDTSVHFFTLAVWHTVWNANARHARLRAREGHRPGTGGETMATTKRRPRQSRRTAAPASPRRCAALDPAPGPPLRRGAQALQRDDGQAPG